eukprot:3413510-Rhodomonas_salina.1
MAASRRVQAWEQGPTPPPLSSYPTFLHHPCYLLRPRYSIPATSYAVSATDLRYAALLPGAGP